MHEYHQYKVLHIISAIGAVYHQTEADDIMHGLRRDDIQALSA